MAQSDIHETVAICGTADQAGLNVRHWFEDVSAGAGATLLEFAAALSTALAPAYKELLSDTATFFGCTAKRVLPLPPSATFSSSAGAGPGLRPGDILPKQVSGLISYAPSPLTGTEKGRSYVPFPAEGSSDALGRPTSTYLADLAALGVIYSTVLAVVGAAGTSQFVPVILTRATATFSTIVASFASPKWATQRRRGDFGRTNVIIGP